MGEYRPEFNGLDPAFQTDYGGMLFDGQYCNHTTMTCQEPMCVVKNTASCYNHYLVRSESGCVCVEMRDERQGTVVSRADMQGLRIH